MGQFVNDDLGNGIFAVRIDTDNAIAVRAVSNLIKGKLPFADIRVKENLSSRILGNLPGKGYNILCHAIALTAPPGKIIHVLTDFGKVASAFLCFLLRFAVVFFPLIIYQLIGFHKIWQR